MKNIAIFLIFVNSLNMLASEKCDIVNGISEFVKLPVINYEGKDIYYKEIVNVDSNKCYAKFVNNNAAFIDYLITNFSSFDEYLSKISEKDSIIRNINGIEFLKKDTNICNIFKELVLKTGNSKRKDTFALDEALDLSVKFFSINSINDSNHYSANICTGLNHIKITQKSRKPFLEAFCFASIIDNIDNKEYKIYDKFVESIKTLYKINLGTDKNECLLRAQGVIYGMMYQSDNLKKLIKNQFQLKKDNLPFVLN